MPEEKKPGGSRFTDKLVPDPNAPPDVVVLVGALGKSTLSGHIRLYMDLEFSDYVEIPEAAVVHKEEFGAEATQGAVGAQVWVKRDAQVITHSVRRAQAEFLSGDIMTDLSAQGG